MSGTAGQVIVVGGGVIGAACAYFLRRAGRPVTVVDAGRFGAACSHANCGYVCPSHVLPLAGPGAAWSGLKALLNPNGPLKIRPRFDPDLWSWLWHFSRRCNRADMLESGRALHPLLQSSRRLYQELIDRENLDCEWETKGLLFVFATAKGWHHYADTDKLMSEEFALPAKRFDADALAALEPALKPGLAGGFLYENDAHLRADRLMAGWRRVLETMGVVIREECQVHDLVAGGRRATAVRTTQGDMTADAFVFATGALTPLLRGPLGCRVPIQPGKGYSITTDRPALCPTYPMLFEEHRVAATPFRSGFRLGSTMEFAGYDAVLNRSRLQLLRDGAAPYLRQPWGETVQEEWFGWRPMTADGKPIIDTCPKMGNVVVAAGHGMLGLSMAPATGQLVAELIDRAAPHIDPTPYSLRRF